jgi:hypothetical protein
LFLLLLRSLARLNKAAPNSGASTGGSDEEYLSCLIGAGRKSRAQRFDRRR